MANDVQAVGFRIGRQSFALPISVVYEIVRPPEITAVPHAPEYVEGVINLRGRIVPVIDLRRRFGASPAEDKRKNRILVVALEGRLAGLLVDSASEVLRIADKEIEPSPKLFGDVEPGYVRGVAKCGGRLVVLLEVDKILAAGPGKLPDGSITITNP